MDAGNMYRSHFGSRYHTRADAVTQAFLRVLFDSLPVANCRLRSLLLETRPRTVNAYAWFACAPNMLQQWRLRKKPATKFPQTGLLQNRTSKPLLAYSAGAPGQKTSVTTAFGPARKQKASKTETTSEHWAEARLKIARMTLTIKRDGNWSSFQLANSALPLSVTSSAIAPSARMHKRGPQQGQQSTGWGLKGLV